jgi:hypothetical protein
MFFVSNLLSSSQAGGLRAFMLRIPGEGEKDSGVKANGIPG